MANAYFSRLLAIAAVAGVVGGQPAPSSAQKFLAFDKLECHGSVTVDTSRIAVRAFEARTFDVANHKVTLSCDGKPVKIVECPNSTTRVIVDRTQSNRYASIVCLSR
jgi:hypothetical protein